MYGLGGERCLPELELPWLPGYEKSAPVRVGNAAHGQLQLDVYGELMDVLHQGRCLGMTGDGAGRALALRLLKHLATVWREPDAGIWEVRGPPRHFTFSKVMAWVAFDRAVRSVETCGLEGPVDVWRTLRAEIHAQICAESYDQALGSFVQAYGPQELDPSLLLLPVVGFLPPDDPRIVGTVTAIERRLAWDGLILRYDTGRVVDGLPPGEGAFLACSLWLADAYVLMGRIDAAQALFERLLALRNDVGLLAEEYDPRQRRQLGNFPQAFSHVGLINTALNLSRQLKPAEQRARRPAPDA
jgi:GH15 family glucan-1,4-alpha-glucosidase